MMETHFDVVISFAEEDRNIAAGIKDCLALMGVKSYYYPDYPVENWGNNLHSHLTELYQYRGIIGLCIYSEHYPIKQFTPIEFEAMAQRHRVSQSPFLFILKTHHGVSLELPGMDANMVWQSWNFNPAQIAKMLKEILEKRGWKTESNPSNPIAGPHQQSITGNGNWMAGGNINQK